MLIISVSNLAKNFGYGSLFEGLGFTLNEGEKISVVGANGCGKSTLFKMLAGLERIDGGTISIKKGATIAYLDQTAPDKSDDRLVGDVIKDAFTDMLKMQQDMDSLITKIEQSTDTAEQERLGARYSNLLEKFASLGGYEIDTNIDIVCTGLGIPSGMLQREYNKLSGGEKTLVHLAKSLLQNPDLFLLDEPTNHLDITRIEWLEGYIKNFKGAVITVSHDRAFLDKISNKILEIDNGVAEIYNTNYSGYLKEEDSRFEKLMANYEDQQAYFARLEEQARRMAQAGMATNSTAMTRKAGVIFARLEREKEKFAIKKPEQVKKIKLEFDSLKKSSKRVIELKNLCVFVKDKKIVDNVSLYVGMGERTAIVGKNGGGKSSIIKTILGEQELETTGEVIVSPSVKIGYLPQIINFANEKQSVLDYFKDQVSIGEEKSRSILSRFRFDREDITKRVGALSGGEKIRLRLAVLLQQRINTLIFDEPTNHIDITTKESLEESIENFDGTLLFISHDRFFINKFAEKVIEINDGKAGTYLGNYNDYIAEKKRPR